MLSNWRSPPRPVEKSAEQGSRITGDPGKSVDGERDSAGSVVAMKRSNVVPPSHKIVKAPRSHGPVRNRGAVALAIDVAFDPARIRVLLPRAEVIFIRSEE